jgi:hypothetical protein
LHRYVITGLLVPCLMLGASITAASSQEMKNPRISPAHTDWQAVGAELEALNPSNAHLQSGSGETRQLVSLAEQELNAATSSEFRNIAESPIPVLLPFDSAAFLRNRAVLGPESQKTAAKGNYLFGFNSIPFFHAGPSGYDAVVVALAKELGQISIGYSDPIYVHISGLAFLYEVPEPIGLTELPNNRLDEPPTVHRIILEDALRYSFVRYGIPYVISIECFDGGSRYGRISCREADKVAGRALRSLRLVGGLPHSARAIVPPGTVDRPTAKSNVFTYHSPGDLVAGTGFNNKGGTADYTVFSRIRFPLAHAPAFANSQSFLNSGDCESKGWSSVGIHDGVAAYRCRVNGQILVWDEAAGENYSYPWRDNFCETRHFQTGQCPAGLGHQGQDIRPAFCRQRNPGDRCGPYIHDVVAVRDGMALRAPGQGRLQLVVNAVDSRARFRYLHMSPKELDAHGLLTGRLVHEGEVIGTVGNFLAANAATTSHLHFELEVPTKYGWALVNPYMTLVTAYERLIRGRGQEIKDEINADPQIGSVASKPKSSSVDSPPRDVAKSP